MTRQLGTRRWHAAALAVPLALLVAGCGNGGTHPMGAAVQREANGTGAVGLSGQAAAAVQPSTVRLVVDSRKLVRTATLEVAVKDVSKAVRAAESATTDALGAVYDERVEHDNKGATEA